MKIVNHHEVQQKLKEQKRVYLCGDLELPDILSSICTGGLEIGISRYEDYTAELPHVHTWNHEYNYVMEGSMKVYVFPEKKEYDLRAGDMFLIEPDMGYITKALKGTQVLFVKDPGGNDKKLIPVTDRIRKWMKAWEEGMENEV